MGIWEECMFKIKNGRVFKLSVHAGAKSLRKNLRFYNLLMGA